MTGDHGERAGLAPTGHPAKDQARVLRQAGLGAEPETFHHAGTKALDKAVGLVDQPPRRIDAGIGLDVECDRFSSPVENRGPVGATDPVTARSVDADNLGPHVGEQHAAMRRRADSDHFDDFDSCQWTHLCNLSRIGR